MAQNSSSEKSKRTSLTRRLCFLIGVVIVLVNVVQVLLVTSNAKKDIVEEDLEMYANMINGYARALQNDLEGYFKELNGYVHSDIVEEGDLEDLYEWIQDPKHVDMRGDFDYIMITGPDGKARTDLGGITDINDRDYFKAIMHEGKEKYVDNPVIGKTTGQPVVHITRPLKDRNGRTFAMISGVLNVHRLTEEIKQIRIGSDGFSYLLAGDGTVIAHQKEEMIMKENFATDSSLGAESLAQHERQHG